MAQGDFEGIGSAEVVIGDGVALDAPGAGVAARVGGGIIDWLIQWALFIGCIVILVRLSARLDEAMLMGLFVASLVGCFVGFPAVMEIATKGRSVGKFATGTRVVRTDRGPITARHSFVRALVGFVEVMWFAGIPAVVMLMFTARTRRLGDLAAGTIVVRERVKLVTPPAPTMPPRLAQWAASADIASIPTGLALGMRQYLTRGGDFSDAARRQVSDRLLEQVLAHVSPMPPTYATKEEILLAVLAERGRRDAERLAREKALRLRLVGQY